LSKEYLVRVKVDLNFSVYKELSNHAHMKPGIVPRCDAETITNTFSLTLGIHYKGRKMEKAIPARDFSGC
jgi:hypothetical protein